MSTTTIIRQNNSNNKQHKYKKTINFSKIDNKNNNKRESILSNINDDQIIEFKPTINRDDDDT